MYKRQAFSQLQSINFKKMEPERVKEIIMHGLRHLEFCMYLYGIQVKQGLYFLHEHPANATSWKAWQVQEIMKMPNVKKIMSDMCAFGITKKDEEGEGLIKKPTAFMSNCPEILKKLSQRCQGGIDMWYF